MERFVPYISPVLVGRYAGSEKQHSIASSWVAVRTERVFGRMWVCMGLGQRLGLDLGSGHPRTEPCYAPCSCYAIYEATALIISAYSGMTLSFIARLRVLHEKREN